MRLGAILALALAILVPVVGDAQVVLPTVPAINPCPVAFLPCGGGGAIGFADYLWNVLFPAARVMFIATAIFFMMQYALGMLLDPDSSETVSNAKMAYGYAITACAIVGISTYVVEAVGQRARLQLLDPVPLSQGVGNIILYMRLIVATLVTVFLLIQGVRLIVKQGSEDEFKNAQTHFLHTAMGVAVILVANVLVSVFFPGSGSTLLAVEIVGIINFTLTLIGALAVFTIIIAGILMVFSIDESLKDRAKKAIFVSLLGLAVAFLSYVLVRFFVNVGLQ